MKKKESFVMYLSWNKALLTLTNDQAGRLLFKLYEWQLSENRDKVEKEIDPDLAQFFAIITDRFNIDEASWIDRCKKNRDNQLKRWEQEKDYNPIQSYSKHTEYDSEYDSEYDADKKKKKLNKEELSFPFSSPAFMEAWKDLVSQPSWKKKTNSALQKTLNKLREYDEEFVIEEINNTIEHGWQGVIYPTTPHRFQEWKKANVASNESNDIESIEDLY